MSLHHYAHGNPLLWIDPIGKEAKRAGEPAEPDDNSLRSRVAEKAAEAAAEGAKSGAVEVAKEVAKQVAETGRVDISANSL
jgi:histone H3/H4